MCLCFMNDVFAFHIVVDITTPQCHHTFLFPEKSYTLVTLSYKKTNTEHNQYIQSFSPFCPNRLKATISDCAIDCNQAYTSLTVLHVIVSNDVDNRNSCTAVLTEYTEN